MSVSTGRSQLYSSLKTLRANWHQTRSVWNDPVAKEFEEKFWMPVDAATTSAIEVMDRLSQVLDQLRKECGEEEHEVV